MRLHMLRGFMKSEKVQIRTNVVLNLTRSGYASSQKFGTVLWSGDIFASWDTMKNRSMRAEYVYERYALLDS